MEKHSRADEETPHHHLPSGCSETRRESGKQSAETIKQRNQQNGPNDIETVEENQFRVFREVAHQAVIGREIFTAREPPDMRPEETLHAGRVDIMVVVRMRMVVAVDRSPPERSTLDRRQAGQRKNELQRTRGPVGLVAKIPVVKRRHKKHSRQV